MRKNMNPRSAATVLSCLRKAQLAGVPGRVYLNRREKTEQDVSNYIRKMRKDGLQGVFTEEDLLLHAPNEEEWPDDVQFVREGCLPPWLPRQGDLTAPHSPVAPRTEDEDCWAVDFQTGPATLAHSRQRTPDDFSFLPDTRQAAVDECTVPLEPSTALLTQDIPEDCVLPETVAISREQCQNLHLQLQPTHTERDSGEHQLEALGPQPSPALCGALDMNDFTTLASANPVSLGFSSSEQEQLIGVLQRACDFGEGPLMWTAIRQCDVACVWANHKEKESIAPHYEEAVDAIVDTFIMVESQQPDDILPLINQMRFHFEYWGQRPLAKTILQRVTTAVSAPASHTGRIIVDLLAFWIDLLEYSEEKLVHWRTMISRTHEDLLQLREETSKPCLAVVYVLAWIALDLGDFDAAYYLLNKYQHVCEHTFGTQDYQTIAWWRALARACYHKKWIQAGDTIFEQLLKPTIERHYFGYKHPLYWEVKYQQGVLKAIAADKNFVPARRRELWTEGIALLKETLVWRGHFLGPDNPSTARAFEWCKIYLQKWGKKIEAEELLQWFEDQCSFENIGPN